MKITVGDITSLNVEVIVNAANGRGICGRGVAGSIGQAGGPEFRNMVRRICESSGGFKAGESYISPTGGNLETNGIQSVYHAVTMEQPGGPTSYDIIAKAMRATLEMALANGVKSIAFPGLGTGVGQLDVERVASIMVKIAESYADSINITIIDIDKNFIQCAKNAITTEA